MKTKHVMLVAMLGLLGISAYKIGEDIIAKLGMDHANAQNYIMANFTGGFGANYEVEPNFMSLPRLKLLATIVEGDKVGAAKELCEYIKMYCNSEEFMAAYQKKRTDSKPSSEPPRMDDAILQGMRDGIKDLEAALTDLRRAPKENAQSIAMFEPMLEEQKATVALYEDPTPNKTKWEKSYPADPAVLVKRKLEEYLSLVSKVDFNAKLSAPDNYKIKKFVNPDYESKSPQWKACYRAGKEVNTAVTAFVKTWLQGEIISSTKTKMPVSSVDANKGNSTSVKAGTSLVVEDGNDALEQNTTAPASEPKKSLMARMKSKAKSIINE
ncbi:hypothetical protein [Arenibacter echinorum]|uniref:Uncharacterized protein n=1 Tax=Arenibacter echinorum TaxID=440515 RepID=A0A327R523_9FLAO|nr:hypothetical protein [Arenibacter echinorum]RAJ11335.1 hypothetical protein LV92_02262 [Arenibacter echinorum]